MDRIFIISVHRGDNCLMGHLYAPDYAFAANGSHHLFESIETISDWLADWFRPLVWRYFYRNPSSHRLDLVQEATLIADGATVVYDRRRLVAQGFVQE